MSEIIIAAIVGAIPPSWIGWLALKEARRAREEAEQAKIHAAEAAVKAAEAAAKAAKVLEVIPK